MSHCNCKDWSSTQDFFHILCLKSVSVLIVPRRQPQHLTFCGNHHKICLKTHIDHNCKCHIDTRIWSRLLMKHHWKRTKIYHYITTTMVEKGLVQKERWKNLGPSKKKKKRKWKVALIMLPTVLDIHTSLSRTVWLTQMASLKTMIPFNVSLMILVAQLCSAWWLSITD